MSAPAEPIRAAAARRWVREEVALAAVVGCVGLVGATALRVLLAGPPPPAAVVAIRADGTLLAGPARPFEPDARLLGRRLVELAGAWAEGREPDSWDIVRGVPGGFEVEFRWGAETRLLRVARRPFRTGDPLGLVLLDASTAEGAR